jgi:DTW domain-containing protein YfiP
LEVDNAKGSARLLNLSLLHSRLATGEVFAEDELQTLLHAPMPAQAIRHTILLYPEKSEDNGIDISDRPRADQTLLKEPGRVRLVVLDGTWRKSRKMLFLNPSLQKLPRLPLRNMPASQYLIRKAHRPDQLSTLEATCYALMQLEEDTEKYLPLLNAFNGFVAQQAGYSMPDQERLTESS